MRPGEQAPLSPALRARALGAHPTILGTLDLLLGDHCSTFQIDLTQLVDIGPGEPAQMIHRDQWSFDHYPFPTGFEAEISTMWAATDFTEEMGATRVVVGSHLWEEDPSEVDPALSTGAVMSKGSVLIYVGSIFTAAAPTPPMSTGSGSTLDTRWVASSGGEPVSRLSSRNRTHPP